ncbi:MAG: TlpA family protein disulfide reductase, partial [Odoribacter sp.]|nr:TlpA family protein disulfide reductase [Odoribacter sp.]
RDFIASQRNLPVNLYLARQLELEPFPYTQQDLDAISGLFANYTDTTADLKQFRETYRVASAYVQGTPFGGGQVYSPKGDTLDLNTLVLPGRYTFIDFWASWCGPCRASFPHLRKAYELYGKRLTFLSVSVDKNDAAWKQAMKEERLPWQQYCATQKFAREIGKKYKITSIPTFLIIDPEGKIVFSGHDSNELDVQLGKL